MTRRKSGYVLVILAAGMSSRFMSDTPKQHLKWFGQPLFTASIKAYLDACKSSIEAIVVVCKKNRLHQTRREVRRFVPNNLPLSVIPGGKRRIDSLFAAARHIEATMMFARVIIAHDAARPLIDSRDIRGVLKDFTKRRLDASILSKPLSESLFRLRGEYLECVDRDTYCLGETPNVFTLDALKVARLEAASLASLVNADPMLLISRHKKYRVGSYKGRFSNIKLTYLHDLVIARKHARERKRSAR